CKPLVIERLFRPELRRLVAELRSALERAGEHGAAALDDEALGAAIASVTARMSVYRTYIAEAPPGAADRARLLSALASAERDPAPSDGGRARALEALRAVLLRTGPFELDRAGG